MCTITSRCQVMKSQLGLSTIILRSINLRIFFPLCFPSLLSFHLQRHSISKLISSLILQLDYILEPLYQHEFGSGQDTICKTIKWVSSVPLSMLVENSSIAIAPANNTPVSNTTQQANNVVPDQDQPEDRLPPTPSSSFLATSQDEFDRTVSILEQSNQVISSEGKDEKDNSEHSVIETEPLEIPSAASSSSVSLAIQDPGILDLISDTLDSRIRSEYFIDVLDTFPRQSQSKTYKLILTEHRLGTRPPQRSRNVSH